MVEEFTCEVCGKQMKNGAGLAGHKMLAHPIIREQTNGSLSEEALAEIQGCIKSSFQRSEQRLEDLKCQVQELQEQLLTGNGRLDDFSESMLERLKVAEKAKLEAENAAQTTQQELEKWQEGEHHHPLRSIWDRADNCEDCAKDKEDILAELAAQSRSEALKAAQEAARVKRFRVTGEVYLAWWVIHEDYEPLPDDVEEPQIGDETDDEVLAGQWRRAGYRVEEMENPSDDASTEPTRDEFSG